MSTLTKTRRVVLGCWTLILFCSLSFDRLALGQQQDSVPTPQSGPPPVDIETVPPETNPGGTVSIQGVAPLIGNAPATIEITVTPPVPASGPKRSPVVINARTDAIGKFAVDFSDTFSLGIYSVKVASTVAKGTGTTTFRVNGFEEDAQEASELGKKLTRGVCDLITVLKSKVDDLPPSPPKTELMEKIYHLETEMTSACQGPEWIARIPPLIELSTIDLGFQAPVREATLEIGAWIIDAKKHQRLLSEAIPKAKAGYTMCDSLVVIRDGFEFCSFVWKFAKIPGEILTKWAMKWAPPKLINVSLGTLRGKPLDDNQKFAVKRLWGAVCCGSETSLVTALYDISAFLAKVAFDRYCQKFEGPISGSMHVEAYAKDMRKWWEYDIEIAGRLTLRYPKESGASVALTGEFQGNATKFNSWDDALQIGFPDLMKGAVLYRFVKEPESGEIESWLLNEIDSGDMAKWALTPASFKVPVKGYLQNDRITVELQPAMFDFTGREARVLYIIVSPLTLGLPVSTIFQLPYKDARFILGRAMDDQPAEFQVVTDAAKKVMTIERVFTRTKENDRTKGIYKLSVKACNPASACGGH